MLVSGLHEVYCSEGYNYKAIHMTKGKRVQYGWEYITKLPR